MTGVGSHRQEEHTADVRLRLFAPSFAELFVQAGCGLAGVLVGDEVVGGEVLPTKGDATSGSESRTVTVAARDAVALLVEWLNELVFLSETSKLVFTSFHVERATETEVVARVSGTPRELKTAVKAATWHGATVRQEQDGWHATVVLDV